ncbi:MAG TPA: response regulator transcription factor [Niastella sp.]
MIRIAIADDHSLVINGLQKIFSTSTEVEIIGTYSNGDQLLAGLQQRQPDVLLLDIQMPGKNGIELAGMVHKLYPEIKMIALTNVEIIYQVRKMMKQGCMGYLLKDVDADTLFSAIQQVYNGEMVVHEKLKTDITNHLLSNNQPQQITRREIEVLQLIAQELTTAQIAEKLFISFATVENHRNRMLQKLGVKNTAGLIKKGMEQGLI